MNASRPSPTRKMTNAATLVVTAGLLLLTACADDEPTAEAPSLDEFCSVAAQLNSQDSLPTRDQLAEYQSLAPEEIAEPTDVVVEAFESAGDNPQAVFTDDAALAAIEELTAFEAEACGLEPPETASNDEIDTDDPTDAGRYSFVMTNAGAEPHLMVVAQLETGVALEDVLASDGDTGVIQSAESAVAPPGGESVVTVDLEPGRWIIVCPIPNEAGESHAALGMLRELTIN